MTLPTIFGDSSRLTTSLGHTRYALLLNKIVNALRRAGCEEVVALPRVVVIGNQSSGKSSLIEAICQIKLSRANGTCTRCPLEIQLSTSNDSKWSGKIWLKMEVRSESGDGELRQQLFTSVSNREEVPLALKRAQLALLYPGQDPSHFLGYSDSACIEATMRSETKLSTNIVVLEISGADVDVCFIDLPGIIQQVNEYSSIADVEHKQDR
jgi:GTPase SAR1 family protein